MHLFLDPICYPAHIYDMAFCLASHHHYLPSLSLWLEETSHEQHTSGTAAVKRILLTVSVTAAYESAPVIKKSDCQGSCFMASGVLDKMYCLFKPIHIVFLGIQQTTHSSYKRLTAPSYRGDFWLSWPKDIHSFKILHFAPQESKYTLNRSHCRVHCRTHTISHAHLL